jgi:hypothetical protein
MITFTFEGCFSHGSKECFLAFPVRAFLPFRFSSERLVQVFDGSFTFKSSVLVFSEIMSFLKRESFSGHHLLVSPNEPTSVKFLTGQFGHGWLGLGDL